MQIFKKILSLKYLMNTLENNKIITISGDHKFLYIIIFLSNQFLKPTLFIKISKNISINSIYYSPSS